MRIALEILAFALGLVWLAFELRGFWRDTKPNPLEWSIDSGRPHPDVVRELARLRAGGSIYYCTLCGADMHGDDRDCIHSKNFRANILGAPSCSSAGSNPTKAPEAG